MFRRLLNVFRPRQVDADIREELEFHRSQTAGSFGNATRIQEQAHEASTLVWLETVVQDLRHGFRQLARTPFVSASAILSLALGIGANTAIFSLVNATLLRSLPVAHPDELSLLVKANRKGGSPGNFSHPFARIAAGAQSFSGVLVTAQPGRIQISVEGADQRVTAESVSASYFAVLRVSPAAGRFFASGEDAPGAPDHVVISYGYWQRRFGLDPGAIGRMIEKDGLPHTIIGVAPPEFYGVSAGSAVDLWHTFSRTQPRFLNGPGMNYLQIIGRRKPGVEPAAAQAETDALYHAHVQDFLSGGNWTPREKEMVQAGYVVLEPGSTGLASLRRQYSQPLRLLLAITGLVLLVACANIANLLLARGTARGRELGLRLAIGASRARVMRQLVTESLLLAALGGVIAAGFAQGGASILVNLMSAGRGDSPLMLDLRPDWRVFGFNAAAAITVGLLFGVLPAARSIGAAALNDRSSAPARARLGKMLIAFQVTLTMVLLFGAGLFLRTLVNLSTVALGYQPNGLYRADLQFRRGTAPSVRPEAYAQLLDQMPRTPGVQSAALCQPFGGGWTNDVNIPAYSQEKVEVYRYQTSPGFFQTMGTPILAGRDFTAQDKAGAGKVVVVNQTLASRYFRGRDPIGQVIQFPRDTTPSEIVGVVAGSRVRGARNESPAIAYTALSQGMEIPVFDTPTLLIRVSSALPDLSSRLKEIHPMVQFGGGSFVSDGLRGQLRQERILALLSSFFGGLAVLLAAIGLFGNLSYVMARRRTEIGVRLALGAPPRQLVALVMREYALIVAVGLTLGAAASLAISRLVRQFLFGVESNDPVTIVVAAVVLSVVSLATAFFPARRASRADPLEALRSE